MFSKRPLSEGHYLVRTVCKGLKNRIWYQPITRRQILNSSKLKEFADDNFKFDKNGRKLSKQIENTVGRGEIARYEQFLLFPQCFQKACCPGASKGVIVWEWVNYCCKYEKHLQTKHSIWGSTSSYVSLTLSQMTNFRLIQIERVCRRQLQIWWKWLKVLQMGRKQCGKRRNCSLRAISPFPTVFLKDLYCRHVKTRACMGKG